MRLTLPIAFLSTAAALAPQEANLKTFASAADVSAMIAKAKNDRKPDQANFVQPLLRETPYTAALEYRVQGINTPPLSHETEAEFIYVVEGAGVLTIGGKLRNEKRANAKNLTGSGVEGGSPKRITKGDFVWVPEKTPHAFTDVEGTLVIVSLHVPAPAGGASN